MQMVACVPYLQRDAAALPLQARNSEDPNSADKYIYLYKDVKSEPKKKKKLDTLQKVCVCAFTGQRGVV